MITKVQISLAGEADIPALCLIGQESFTAAYGPFNSEKDLHAHLDKHYSENAILEEIRLARTYMLASYDGSAVGLAKLVEDATPTELGGGHSLEIQQLYVMPDKQRLGAGKRLLDAAMELATRRKLIAVWLGVWERAHWAIKFYERYGFTRFGSHDFYLGDSRHRDLLMNLNCPS